MTPHPIIITAPLGLKELGGAAAEPEKNSQVNEIVHLKSEPVPLITVDLTADNYLPGRNVHLCRLEIPAFEASPRQGQRYGSGQSPRARLPSSAPLNVSTRPVEQLREIASFSIG